MTGDTGTASTKPFDKLRYYAFALDPVHIGTGGYGLGRVDNAIVREPGTNLPKIPGSSTAGPARAYTALALQSTNPAMKKYQRIIETDENGNAIYGGCAGKGKNDGDSHCGEPNCEVCVTYGFSQKSGSAFQGLAQFFDAKILFFPVYSMYGPVWVTSPSILAEIGYPGKTVDKKAFKAINTTPQEKMNFGWLLLERDGAGREEVGLTAPPGLEDCFNLIKDRVYLLPDNLFSRVVNDNLEVRTSVSIDPFTGAAESGALFTYEAVPRATLLWFDVVYSDPAMFRIDKDGSSTGIAVTLAQMKTAVQNGFEYFKTLGVGGMNTRGMGRLKVSEGVAV